MGRLPAMPCMVALSDVGIGITNALQWTNHHSTPSVHYFSLCTHKHNIFIQYTSRSHKYTHAWTHILATRTHIPHTWSQMVIYYNSYCSRTHRHIFKLLEGFLSVNHAVEFSMSTTFRPQNVWPTSVAKGAQKQNCMHHHSHSQPNE